MNQRTEAVLPYAVFGALAFFLLVILAVTFAPQVAAWLAPLWK